MWKTDFEMFLKALKGKAPRPVFYDLHMDDHIAEPIAGKPSDSSPLARFQRDAKAFAALGYDYAPTMAPSSGFKTNAAHGKESATMNVTMIVKDRPDYEKYHL